MFQQICTKRQLEPYHKESKIFSYAPVRPSESNYKPTEVVIWSPQRLEKFETIFQPNKLQECCVLVTYVVIKHR